MTSTEHWSVAAIRDLTGTSAVVTGASSGIGLETATQLAAKNASVVLVCRSEERGLAALSKIKQVHDTAILSLEVIDLSDLAEVKAGAERLAALHPVIDLLINNAGIMMIPFGLTADGHELQFGTNHLGHFALTAGLIDQVMAARAGRVVTISSLAHREADLDLDDLLYDSESYKPQPAYRRSKLANLMFSYELERRLRRTDSPAISVAAHPGLARTNLAAHFESAWWARIAVPLVTLFMQNAAEGARAQLRAATDVSVLGGTYYGPGGRWEAGGPPVVVASSERSHDLELASALWSMSEALTGTTVL